MNFLSPANFLPMLIGEGEFGRGLMFPEVTLQRTTFLH
jgi:hypothetical protein